MNLTAPNAYVLLAGGKSARVGMAKQLLATNNRFLLEQIFAHLPHRRFAHGLLITGLWHDCFLPIIQKFDRPRGWLKVLRNYAHAGDPFESVKVATRFCLTEGLSGAFFCPTDIPFIQKKSIEKMVEEVSRHPQEILKPRHGGRGGHPIFIPHRYFELILNFQGNGGLRGFLSHHGLTPKRVDIDDPGILKDIDSLDDFTSPLGGFRG